MNSWLKATIPTAPSSSSEPSHPWKQTNANDHHTSRPQEPFALNFGGRACTRVRRNPKEERSGSVDFDNPKNVNNHECWLLYGGISREAERLGEKKEVSRRKNEKFEMVKASTILNAQVHDLTSVRATQFRIYLFGLSIHRTLRRRGETDASDRCDNIEDALRRLRTWRK